MEGIRSGAMRQAGNHGGASGRDTRAANKRAAAMIDTPKTEAIDHTNCDPARPTSLCAECKELLGDAGEQEVEMMEETETPKAYDPRPCETCGKPRAKHRGVRDHRYAPMTDAAAAARAKRAQDEVEDVPAAAEKMRATPAVKPKRPRGRDHRSPAPKQWSFLELAQKIDELRGELEAHVTIMREMLG